AAAQLGDFAPPVVEADSGQHAANLRRFVLEAAPNGASQAVLVVGALAEPALPLAELCARFERVTLNDLDLPRLEALVRHAVPEQHRQRVQLERYDASGSYAAFAAGVKRTVEAASSQAEAEQALLAWLQTYDVGAGSAGLGSAEAPPDLAVSAMLLTELGRGYAPCIASALTARGWSASGTEAGPLADALTLLRAFVVQHHLRALSRRAKSAVLISAVSRVDVRTLPNGKAVADGEPRDLLSVERLVERLPSNVEVKDEQSWEWRQDRAGGAVITLIEAVRL
ncbi:MAG TPA: hypothetical protein VEQ58_18430, partial [Polyangiaceae bacterium]|nr:hypothetical protein [Polyangiaceae bacterium]